jgi:mannose-6-phosphate isomerase-like protein (cupin superfamily)
VKPIVLRPGEGESLTLFGNTLELKAGAAETDGGLCLVDYSAGPGFAGPPPHRHNHTFDMFFVLEGELTMRLDDETVTVPSGSFVLVPPGVVHTFSNPGESAVRYLSLMTPGGFEQYFLHIRRALGDGPPDPAMMGELMAKYDIELEH